jgi:hypothetical protein|nr:MAG TPA: hypothetical protein [Caudoviricetes sp.]
MKKETLERAIELKAEINRTENCLKGLKNRAFFTTECRLRFNLSVLGYLDQGGFELTDKLKTKIEATIREYVEDLKRELESL